MGDYHSTVSRRDFMKGLGLLGTGMGAASLVSPRFHDLDELISSASTHPTHPWFVKEREQANPTSEVDWKIFKQWDKVNNNIPTISDEAKAFNAQRDRKFDMEGLINKLPGRDRRAYALAAMVTGLQTSPAWDGTATTADSGLTSFTDAEVPRWEGSPEDNTQMLRAAIHLMGSNNAGALELDDKMTQIFDKDAVAWENIPKAFQDTKTKIYHIPDKAKYMATCSIQQNYTQATFQLRIDNETYPGKMGLPNPLGRPSIHRAYGDGRYVDWQLQRFLNKLGYQAYKCGITANVAVGIFSGLGEQGRATYMMTPRSGLMTRITNYWITDLPQAPTNPIDFGGSKFCESCMRCAELCPSESLGEQKEPVWESSKGNRPGYKGWRVNWETCINMGAPSRCGVCHTLCPFNHPPEAMIHPTVRTVIAATNLFNKFFADMDRQFQYGNTTTAEELDGWWTRNLNTYKGDVIHGAGQFQW
ncbi:reductive dehalogenase [Dehalogenimonas alkenigignens]|uniref:reductive dehalogenase n=1 Tax=Dehalogenimonas alkenigignens TaxID=1217799 RepID=UPI000D582B92|nr:reductive dehalogenase [Dehalogenimonas alkenigignens]PVV82637.1 reductive dehalogenase [Dehalogenimonas alkenigignens]